MILFHTLPEELSGEAAAHIVEILYTLAATFENQYAAHIRHYYEQLTEDLQRSADPEHPYDDGQLDLFEDPDIAF